jgi:ADP-ribose pyrophosphatase
MSGRGSLGRFGPNHAADPVISTWRRNGDGSKILDEAGNPTLQFVAIMRKDTGDWAIPGGMVDPGENVSLTLKREFGEETMASMEMRPDERATLMDELEHVFKRGVLVYR